MIASKSTKEAALESLRRAQQRLASEDLEGAAANALEAVDALVALQVKRCAESGRRLVEAKAKGA